MKPLLTNGYNIYQSHQFLVYKSFVSNLTINLLNKIRFRCTQKNNFKVYHLVELSFYWYDFLVYTEKEE